jgi:hypothetical protein
MKKPNKIKIIVPHSELELANKYLAKGYKQTWVSFEGVMLVKTKKVKKGGK